jgi:hypothetical protein
LSSTEESELIMTDLMQHLQDVDGVSVVVRGEHKIPDISQFPAIAIIEGDDIVTEASRRGNKRQWDVYFALFVQGTDADDELPALGVFRQAFRNSIAEARSLLKPRNGLIFEVARYMPMDAEMGNFTVVQTLAYRIIYAEPSLG